MNLLLQLLVNGIVQGVLYSLVAISFGFIFRSVKAFDLSVGGIYIIAAYLLYTFKMLLQLPIVFSILLVLIGIIFVEYLNEKYVFGPFINKHASSGTLMIVSLGAYIVIENLIALMFGNDVKILKTGIEPSITFSGIIITRMQIIQFITGILLLIALYITIKKTDRIKALWAMGENFELLNVLGFSITGLRRLVYIISGFFIATASILTTLDIGTDPHMGLSVLMNGATAVIVGGSDKFEGWILGSFVLAELNALVIFKFSNRWTPLVTFALLILILLFRPQGLIGSKLRLEEMFRSEG